MHSEETLRRIDITMRNGVQWHQQGNLAHAESHYVAVLDIFPDFPDALHLLGLIRYQQRDFQQAAHLIERAINGNSVLPLFYFNLGKVYRDWGRRPDAILCYEQAWQLQPGDASVAVNLGHALTDEGRMEAAERLFKEALGHHPCNAQMLNGLGIALQHLGRLAEAEHVLRDALLANPHLTDAHVNLSSVLRVQERSDDALLHANEATRLAPSDTQMHHNLGVTFLEASRYHEAGQAFKQALLLDSDNVDAQAGLGLALLGACRHKEALFHLKAACQSESVALSSRQAMLCAHNYSQDEQPGTIFHAHRVVGCLLEQTSALDHALHVRGPRLRIGYVSPDFRSQSCAYFIMPLLANHDRNRVKIFLYSCVKNPDEVTKRFHNLADVWREVAGTSDDDLAQLIHDDGIDILVDLAGHMDGNRLAVFARKPAPIQVTWLGYPNTTGLSRMDYRITDAHADPAGEADHLVTEKLIRLTDGFHCFQPLHSMPDAGVLPASRCGHITFGSFNNLAKLTIPVIETWAEILRHVSNSHLYLKSHQLSDAHICERVLAQFESLDVGRHRVILEGRVRKVADHYLCYKNMDIALDPFPYNGTTTTCEALWMGVPVITLAGDRHAARVGLSLLLNVGCPELVAETRADYVNLTVNLAGDIQRIENYRRDLRSRFCASPLYDGAAFAQAIESVYEDMWQALSTQNSFRSL